MKFRQRLFWILAVLVVLYVSAAVLTDTNTSEICADASNTEVCNAAASVGAGIGTTIVLCIGAFLFTVFALLAWRNGVGLATERRHQEQLAVAREGRGVV